MKPPLTPTQTYSPRPLRGSRLNDTKALVTLGIPPPQGAYELHSRPSAEASVTDPSQGGTRDSMRSVEWSGTTGPPAMGGGPGILPRRSPAPDAGNTLRRTMDYMACRKGH